MLSLKATLKNTKPPIWPRIVTPDSVNPGDLHTAIQIVRGWDDCHLHGFDAAGEQYGDRADTEEAADEGRLKLSAWSNPVSPASPTTMTLPTTGNATF